MGYIEKGFRRCTQLFSWLFSSVVSSFYMYMTSNDNSPLASGDLIEVPPVITPRHFTYELEYSASPCTNVQRHA